MSVASPPRPLTVALIGNPNTGKSTLFSGLSGLRQRVGTYPGVTVEKKIGRMEIQGRPILLVDLPGTYSLAPRSPDEMVAVEVLLGRRGDVAAIDVVLCIVDASNLERNLYLVSQVFELGLPTVVALNMVDVAKEQGLSIDLDRLRKQLPAPVVAVQANRGIGLHELKRELLLAADRQTPVRTSPFPEPFCREVERLCRRDCANGHTPLPRYLLERLLLDTSGYVARSGLPGIDEPMLAEVKAARSRLAAQGLAVPGVEAVARYGWAGEVCAGVIQRPVERPRTLSDRLDRALTHRVWGTLVFLLVMLLMFQAVYYVPDVTRATWALDQIKGLAADGIARLVPEGAFRSLLVTGVIEGVGGVVVFLPQIFTLFFFIAVLEDCGYMARAAYLMDKLMSRIGLSGKSFIPLLSSFACAVPGIMATRVIENRRDRLVTILIAPLMSCSARLPVYALLIAAFIPNRSYLGGLLTLHGLVLLAMYSLGIVAGIAVAWILKRTILRGPTPAFVMELPSYKLPGLRVVLHRMLEQGWAFIYRAGTLILAVSVLVWGLAYYPHDESLLPHELLAARATLTQQAASGRPVVEELAHVENQIQGAHLEASYLGRMGKLVEPLVRPLGWDWRIGCAAIASFPAREVVIATLGVIYNLGEGQDEESGELSATLRAATWQETDRPVFTIPVALSVMVFFALCAQCASTLAIMRRETGSWRWPAFTFAYMTMLAYLGAFLTFQVGTWIGL
ncbi:MAG TPA: ferrous iron transport protein B [Pirellulaceae bacterium]|nr:ferrous iron transport protein B [Pirellulaceae bacterium]